MAALTTYVTGLKRRLSEHCIQVVLFLLIYPTEHVHQNRYNNVGLPIYLNEMPAF